MPTNTPMIDNQTSIITALAWCLAWGEKREPQQQLALLKQMRESLNQGQQTPSALNSIVEQVRELQNIPSDYFPETIAELTETYSNLCQENTKIGLVYGGATKIKGYVFESAKLQEIRGASAILDRINLIDLPGFFGEFGPNKCYLNDGTKAQQWLETNYPGLSQALIPELIIYSTGGNILAFCPVAFVDDLSDAIEKRYTQETITANSAAVGDSFRLIEFRFGLLQQNIEKTNWLDWYTTNSNNKLVEAYYGKPNDDNQGFQNRKSFNELVGHLATKFNQRRNGNLTPRRSSRRYPVILETHPYLIRDENDRASAISQEKHLPGDPYFSEPLARKRIVGQRAKREGEQNWYKQDWEPGEIESWVRKFEIFLETPNDYNYYRNNSINQVEEARSLQEIGNGSNGFVSFIYADGNNMGGYIQKIKSPEEYQSFSRDIFEATEQSVYRALAKHLKPHKLTNLSGKDNRKRNGKIIHPFEIITIGGDDVLLIVPANQALVIAKTIGEEFEKILCEKETYLLPLSEQRNQPQDYNRYLKEAPEPSLCRLSMSMGVLIIADDTPIYYAQKLTEQLLKSAKQKAKSLKTEYNYHGGTIDFLVLKSVTMIASTLKEFRDAALVKNNLKLYGNPYTLHEIGGLIKTVQALAAANFPRSQLYQIRTLLESGKNTAMLNYRYFVVRLSEAAQNLLKAEFEDAWCKPKDSNNNGNLAPWMSIKSKDNQATIYETIWRELVDIYGFVGVTEIITIP